MKMRFLSYSVGIFMFTLIYQALFSNQEVRTMENVAENLIKEKLKKILTKELKVELEDITDDSHIADDIGVESAEMINLLYNIETEFDVEISNEEASKNLTIQKMADLVKEKISAKSR
ncbi:MAG: acyl carrier protein [Candidatus Brocadia sp.]|nr:acyl carrier protein [Candidatus Brocadia sp.]